MSVPHKLYVAGVFSLVAIAGVASYYFVQTERSAFQLEQDLDRTVQSAGQTVTAVNATLVGNSAKGDPGLLRRSSLLVANADEAMNALKQTMQQINKASKANEPQAAQIASASLAAVQAGQGALTALGATIMSLDSTIQVVRTETLPRLNGSVDALTGVTQGMLPVEQNAATLLASGNAVMRGLQTTVGSANLLLADPDITAVAKNLNTASASGASVMAHLDKATGYIEYDLAPKHIPFWSGLASQALSQALGIPLKLYPARVQITGSVPLPVK